MFRSNERKLGKFLEDIEKSVRSERIIPSFTALERIMKLLVDDLHGKVAESRTGWPDDKDNLTSAEWSRLPSLVSNFNNTG